MNGNAMYEVAKLRVADMQRTAQRARDAREAREARTAARRHRARVAALEAITTPVSPDFAEEMFAATGEEGSLENPRGRHARSGH
jgi:hypothetical protein